MAEEGHRVTLNVYDLSQGLARQLSTSFLGKAIEAIWHTGIVVYGNEYYFGGGIQHSPAGLTPYGTPLRMADLGVTHVPKDVFEMYLQEISPRYTAETYNLLTHNCNNFTNEVTQFLVGATIPEYILQLPNEVMSSPMGAFILPMIQNLETTLRSGAVPQVPQFRPSTVQPLRPASTNTETISSGPNSSTKKTPTREVGNEVKSTAEDSKTTDDAVPLAVKPAVEQQKSSPNRVAGDPLGDARNKVQDEIVKEFAAIMATGTMRAGEAAALAARRVMQRHGQTAVSELELVGVLCTFSHAILFALTPTGFVVYGKEYYFGVGIQHSPAGSTPDGTPLTVIGLGITHVPKDVFKMYLQEINPLYTAMTYNLLTHNCDNFTNEVAQFLAGATIPEYILQLPNEVMGSPMGALILPMIQNLERTLRSSGAVPQVPQFRPSTVQPLQPASTNTEKSSIGPNFSTKISSTRGVDNEVKGKAEGSKTTENAVPPSVKPAGEQQKPSSPNGAGGDPLGDALNKVQDEIAKEFAAIMATGTMRASEAAALAARKVRLGE